MCCVLWMCFTRARVCACVCVRVHTLYTRVMFFVHLASARPLLIVGGTTRPYSQGEPLARLAPLVCIADHVVPCSRCQT